MQRKLIYQGNSRKPVSHAILHCGALPPGWAVGKTPAQARDIIEGWHKARGMKQIGYHYLVMPNGHVALGRPLNIEGAHTFGHNKNTLGVLMVEVGYITQLGTYLDYFTPVQMQAVRELLAHHGITKVTGHNDHVPKLCPGFRVTAEDFLSPVSPETCWQRIGRILRP